MAARGSGGQRPLLRAEANEPRGGPGGLGPRVARDVLVPLHYKLYDFALDHSWIQNLAYWPINLMMHELSEKKIAKGYRTWRKHRALDVPFGF